MSIAIFLSTLVGLMAIGMPVAFALMLTGVALMYQLNFFDAQLVAQNMIAGADIYPLMAVPCFILAGELMNAGGISKRVIGLAASMVGHIRGGLGFVAIGATLLLGCFSGSALADTAAVATILLPMMRDHGYPVPRSAGLIAAGGVIAPIVPPSMPFIIFGVATNTSISALFVAGIVPALLRAGGLVMVWTLLSRNMTAAVQPRRSWAERGRALVDSLWALVLPVLIVGGLRGGIFTPTEASAVAAVYALVVSLFVYREVKFSQLADLFVKAARTTATVMFLCAAAFVSSYMVTLADLPAQVTDLLSRNMTAAVQPRRSWAERGRALVDSLWALVLPVLIVGGLRGGIFTPTEASAVAAVYALVVSLFVYREVKFSQLSELFVKAARTTATVMFLCAAAFVSSYMVTLADLPAQVTDLLSPMLGHPRLLMAAVMVLLLAIGSVMDLTPTILVLGPVLMPLVMKAGIDPTYFGVMFILVGTLGLIHPPVCTVLNVVSGIARISLESATRGVWPFLLIEGVLVFLFVAYPGFITVPMAWFR